MLGDKLVADTNVRMIWMENITTGKTSYWYFGTPCDKDDILEAICQIKATYNMLRKNARRYKEAAELYRQAAIEVKGELYA